MTIYSNENHPIRFEYNEDLDTFDFWFCIYRLEKSLAKKETLKCSLRERRFDFCSWILFHDNRNEMKPMLN